ncbi:MAG TPA: RsmE family RNA methyltransferase [Gemmatimonadaceae bacterium]|nr:RsmE family RNA methyltransferase [Gemmatimonadaceae bacterium]
MTTFFVEDLRAGEVELGEEAAHHAHVRRVAVGEPVNLTDGRGHRGEGRITLAARKTLRVHVDSIETTEPPPAIHLFVPVADKERMLWVAEKATELQVASWNPVLFERSKSVTPRGEGEAFERKVHARMLAALEQSGGAWMPETRPVRSVSQIAAGKGLMLERGGDAIGRSRLAAPLSIAVGPEGGFTPAEVSMLREGGWAAASLGDVTLRFETAAIGAVAIARALLS